MFAAPMQQTPNATPAAQRTSAATSGKWAASRWPPHLLFPRFLCEDTPAERQAGLKMARKLLTMCDEMWVFGDRISQGMAAEIAEAAGRFIPIYHMSDALTLTIEARQARRGW